MEQAIKYLQEMAIWNVIHGFKPDGQTVRIASLEPDGRKQAKTLRILCEQNYLVKDGLGSGAGQYLSTTKAYQELEEAPYDWSQREYAYEHGKEDTMDRCWVGFTHGLSRQEQKHVLENKDQYQICWCDAYSSPRVYHPYTTQEADQDSHHPGRWHVVVTTQKMLELARLAIHGRQREDTLSRNLAWGLQKLIYLSDEDAKDIKQYSSGPFLSGDVSDFGLDRHKWKEDLPKALATIREAITGLQKREQLLQWISSRVEEYGGWDKFLADYEKSLDLVLASKAE